MSGHIQTKAAVKTAAVAEERGCNGGMEKRGSGSGERERDSGG
jgi:hypothetical protein